MYGAELGRSVADLRSIAQIEADPLWLLDSSLSCFLEATTQTMGGRVTPQSDFVETSLRLLLVTDTISRSGYEWGGIHYLLGTAYEQCAFVASSLVPAIDGPEDPLQDDEWCRLMLAALHYLAGAYRVQAVATLRRLWRISERRSQPEYQDATRCLQALFDARSLDNAAPRWRRMIFQDQDLPDAIEAIVNRLSRQVRAQRGILLSQLGRDAPEAWLRDRGVSVDSGVDFWRRYVAGLETRGIVSFTREQFGEGFDFWLDLTRDLLVGLPTGSGKSLIGELRTALTLAAGHSCVWLQPTRALVRQSRRELRRAFRHTGINVEELPTTEDASALFADSFDESGPVVAVTTPERLSAMMRTNPSSMDNVHLLIVDEAQLLCSEERGVTAEHVLATVRQVQPDCRIVLMTAFFEVLSTLRDVLIGLGGDPRILSSATRPTRRVYGVLRASQVSGPELQVLVYPPRPPSEGGAAGSPPFQVRFPDRAHTGARGASDVARRFSILSNSAGLRSVIFVSQKRSTESQAEALSRRGSRNIEIPLGLVARLRLELGRDSVLERVVPHTIAPHHAGLTSLEQHLVERLVAEEKVLTVFATPTLAQGVNLPFDLALVTFTQRRNEVTQQGENLSEAEVQNMLGRAGRAGMVPDGLCLIARKETTRDPELELYLERRWFFSPPSSQPAPGIVSLLRRAQLARVDQPGWADAMSGLRFSESQALLSMVARRLQAGDIDMSEELAKYPSFRALPDQERARLTHTVVGLASNIGARLLERPAVLEIAARSGLPIGMIEAAVSEISALDNVSVALDPSWWDEAIGRFLTANAELEWVGQLSGPFGPGGIVAALDAWRSGAPVSVIEALAPADDQRLTRIHTGQYLNHALSLLAQLWGVAPLVIESLAGDEVDSGSLRALSACIRDGVPTTDALIWLRALGGMDRVLATRLGELALLPDEGGYYARRRTADDLLDHWTTSGALPLAGDLATALRGHLHEAALVRGI